MPRRMLPSRPRASDVARRALTTALAVASLAVAPSCGDDDPVSLPASGAPAAFEVSFAGYGYVSTSVTLDGEALVIVRALDANPGERTTTIVTPTDADWAAFWTAARRVGLARWPRSCVNTNVVDGSGLSVDITFDGGQITRSAMNAYPRSDGACVRGGIDPTDEYMAFFAAMGELIGRSFP